MMPDLRPLATTVVRDDVERAAAQLRKGRPVLLTEIPGRAGETEMVLAADRVGAASMAYLVRHTSGLVGVALPDSECARLHLPAMVDGSPQRVSVDLIGTGTGISARDRAATVAALASPATTPDAFTRPGHVLPVSAAANGVLGRVGVPEAGIDLARAAGLVPVVAYATLEGGAPGALAGDDTTAAFAAAHGLVLVSVEQVVQHRRRTDPLVAGVATATLPTEYGSCRAVGYRALHGDEEHLALVAGEVRAGWEVPVHVHRECLIGDVLGSSACACAESLRAARTEIAAVGRGVVVYLRSGGSSPVRCGLDGRSADASQPSTAPWGDAAAIIEDLGIRSVRPVGHADVAAVAAILGSRAVTSAIAG